MKASASRTDFDIAICGGGMVGAALAGLLLTQPRLSELRIALIEARLPTQPPGEAVDIRVSALSRASQRLLERVGAWSLIPETQRSAYQAMRVWDAASHPQAADALQFTAAALGEPNLGHIIANNWIQWSALEAARDARITRFDSGLATVTTTDNGMQLRVEDGRQFSATLVMGADGAHSKSRECMGITSSPKPYQQTALVTHIRTERSHQATAWQRFLPTGPLAFLPLQDGRSSIVWSTTPETAQELLTLDEASLGARIAAASDYVLGDVQVAAPRGAFPLQLAQVQEYTKPGFVLIGDAAHSVHPLAGQGVNLGLMDAACLVQVLHEALLSGASVTQLGELRVLRRYERWRKSENTLALGLMDCINTLFSNSSPTVQRLRRTGLSLVQRSSLLKRTLMLRALGLSGERPEVLRSV